MASVVGMTTDPAGRKREHERNYRNLRNWRRIASDLIYYEAQTRETQEARRLGCHAHPGGPYVAGRVWSVYCFQHS